jgi:hypothetical protein
VQFPSDQGRARQVSSECCHSPGDRWVRSVHSGEAGREGSAPKSVHSSDADVFEEAEGSIQQQPLLRGCAGIGGVFSPGHVSKKVGREPKRAPHLLPHQEERLWIRVGRYVQPRGDRRKHGRMVEQSYNPIVRAEQRVVQEGSSPSGARMRGAISESGGNSSLAEESRRYADV